MSVQFSPVVDAQARRIPAFSALQYIDLEALGVHASPLAVVDDFRVQELPFSAHPHAGFAAVTYVFEDSPGAVRSRTSTGADLVVGPGGIVWTNAGSGIIHEEVPAQPGWELHGLQLFVNLTAKNKLSAPRVLYLEGDDVPEWESDAGDRARVVVGAFDGVSSPLVPDEPFTLLDVELRDQMQYAVEPAHNTVLYVLDGSLSVRAGARDYLQFLSGGQALALSGGPMVTFEAVRPAHFVVLCGAEIDEPVVEKGPFIMNDRSQIEAAMARYRSGEMGGLSPSSYENKLGRSSH
jgi:redox-sensitive bicupin YhaK (pirin superfamily)